MFALKGYHQIELADQDLAWEGGWRIESWKRNATAIEHIVPAVLQNSIELRLYARRISPYYIWRQGYRRFGTPPLAKSESGW